MTAQRKLTLGSARGRERLRRSLLAWYDSHRRDLPWRQDRDPYRVWLSEIMLQQTRVAAVLEHYQAFLGRFPTIEKLAAAREASVLAAWSGLGYYRRARMLHAAAKEIVSEHAGKFPPTAEQLRTLPGIGRYTAAAIASIAFGEPVAVVDGNVQRVLERLLHQPLASRGSVAGGGRIAGRPPAGRFQSGDDGTRGHGLPPSPAAVFGLSGVSFLRHAGRWRKTQAETAAEKARDSLCARLPQRLRVPDRTAGRGIADAGYVGAAGDLESADDPASVWLTLRHSITTTDYLVRVRRAPAYPETKGRWVLRRRVWTLPLTGLARKILRAAGFEE